MALMAATQDDDEGNESAAVPPIVDRATWQAAREELLVREKAHMRAGDMLAAGRRRLPMVEVDASTTVIGPDGPRTLLDLFEGREELVVYRHMWFPGELFENQCEGCTMTYWATQSPVYLNARGVSFAVFAPGPYSELRPFIEFMGYPRHWYSTFDVEDDLVGGDGYGAWTSWLRQDDRVFLTNTMTGRGLEVSMVALALLDLTVRGRLEAWQDYPEGWPEGKQPGWFWRADEDGVGNNWTGGRPTAQWTRPGATPVRRSGEHHH